MEDTMELNEVQESNTVFDDVFRTMLERIPEIMIPLINEIFSTNYPDDEPITQLKNEHFTKSGVTITDCVLGIREKHYHLECQSTPDRTIALRIIEHDMALALQSAKEVELSGGSEHDYEMFFPHSCVIYLRHNEHTKDCARVRILFQDGTHHCYDIPIIKAQNYTKDELFEKNLLALLPYYFMRYERSLPELCRDEEASRVLLAELLDIRTRLEQAIGEEKGLIYTELISHIQKIDNHIFRKHKEMRKRMEAITMGGQVYKTLTVEILEQGIEQGIEQGDRLRLLAQIQKKLAKGKSLEQIADELEETVEVIRPLYEQVVQEMEADEG